MYYILNQNLETLLLSQKLFFDTALREFAFTVHTVPCIRILFNELSEQNIFIINVI